MGAVSIQIDDTATPAVHDIEGERGGRKMLQAVRVAATEAVRANFAKKEAGPHKSAEALDATPTHLYRDFADATTGTIDGSNITVTVADVRAAQRFYGGTIEARDRKLTIPAIAAAYGKRASEISTPLVFGFGLDSQSGAVRPALVAENNFQRTVTRGKNRGEVRNAKEGQQATTGKGTVFFWLVQRVSQDPDPSVLPTDDELSTAIEQALEGWAAQQGLTKDT